MQNGTRVCIHCSAPRWHWQQSGILAPSPALMFARLTHLALLSPLGLRRSLVRSKNPGKESAGTWARPGQTDHHYKCHPSQHKLSPSSHLLLSRVTCFSVLRPSSEGPARVTQRAGGRGHVPPGDGAQVHLLPRIPRGRLRPRQVFPLQHHGSVVWARPHLQAWVSDVSTNWLSDEILSNISAITCGEPEDIPAGILERKCQTFGCRISYTCEPGYQLAGRTHRYCQADGSWSPQLLPECKRELKLVIMTSNAPETVHVVCAGYLLFRPWLVSHKYVTLFQPSPAPLPRIQPLVAWCSTRWPTTPWSPTSATTATWSSGRLCGGVTGARGGPGSSPSAEVTLTLTLGQHQTHCCDICRAIPQNIVNTKTFELKVVTTGDYELVKEIWWGQLDKIRSYTTVCKPNLFDQQ